jgi:hypothetical protein
MTQPVALYRHYDDAGRLLYVGVSADPARRFWEHKSCAEWAARVARSELVWYANRDLALHDEARAISDLAPEFNAATHVCGEEGSAAEFIRIVGMDVIAQRLGVSRSAVRNAQWRRSFPGMWAYQIAMLAAEYGVPCRIDAFRWAGETHENARNIADVFFAADRGAA